jgi:hypothetical protein
MANQTRWASIVLCATAAFAVCCGQVVVGQSGQTAAAWVGDGWGIGRVEIPAGQIASDATVRIVVTEKGNRILYPANEISPAESDPLPSNARPLVEGRRIGGGALVKRVRGAIDRLRQQIDPVEVVRVHFLFTGTEPLQIEIRGDVELSFTLDPSQFAGLPVDLRADRELYTQMLGDWWNGYIQQTERQVKRSDYPTMVERYMVHMLGNRLGLPVPDLLDIKSKKGSRPTDPRPTLSLIAGVESLRDEISERLWLEPTDASVQRQSIPKAPRWEDMPLPEIPADIGIENIAQAVPEDFLYVRFGSFSNYLWFQQIGESRGGDLAQLALLRGYNYEATARVERMLNMRLTALAKLFGDSIIADMAVVGHDLYMQEGPSMGLIFEAKNFAVLKASMEQERLGAVKRLGASGCKLENIEIDGRSVSFLHTPDNQIRAFMVEAAPYLFVTTSQTLAQRFLEVQRTKQSLANNQAFRYARWMMPLDNQYDVFAYFSSEFLRNLISPQYQIELKRRMQANASIEMIELASLVDSMESEHGFTAIKRRDTGKAEAQNLPLASTASNDIERWISKGYLPPWFQSRGDGSELLQLGDQWIDSTRGRRGSFLPIADVLVTDCSREEAAEYEMTAEFYASQWQETDPLMFGLRRFAHPELPKVERLAIEAYVAPLGSEKYGAVGMLLAPPVASQVMTPPDDVVNVQVRLAGLKTNQMFSEDHFLFAGLKDLDPPLPEETKGLLAILRLMRTLPVYIGAWPKPGFLDRLPVGLGGGPPDVMGFSRSLLGIWRWQMGGFSVISFDRAILDSCAMHVMVADAPDYAQGRLQIRNVSTSRVAALFNTLGFRQAAQTTRGNLLFLDSMQQQLGVKPERAKLQAEELLDAKLQCTLGGDYRYVDGTWTTTAWPDEIRLSPHIHASSIGFDSLHTIAPEGYQTSWLQWFRGAKLHLTQLPERLVVIGEIDMEPLPPMKKPDGEIEKENALLPKLDFDLYNLPFEFFKKDKPKNGDKPAENQPKPEQKAAPKSRQKF